MSMYGADADSLDRVGQEAARAADFLDSTQSTLGRALHSAPWQGNSAERFRQRWDGEHRRSMAQAAAFLRDASTILHTNASEQRDASSAAGGGPGGGGTGGSDAGPV